MDSSSHPLLTAGLHLDGTHSAFTYSRAVQRGRLLRLRRGVYIPTVTWFESHPSQRYQLMIAATGLQLGAPVFCRDSALQIHSLPLLHLPTAVHLRASSRATVRTTPQPPLTGRLSPAEFWDQAQSSGAAAGLRFSASGFRGFSTARHTPSPSPESTPEVQQLLADPSPTGEHPRTFSVHTESMSFALVDTVPRMEFDAAIVTLDAALRGEGGRPPAETTHLQQMAETAIDSQRMRRYFQDLLDFASPLAESPGESLARARFHQLGFAQPRLQVGMSIDGSSYRVDFLWEGAGVVGEFDGWKKYESGNPRHSLQQEKIREDAIRSTGRSVFRFYWEDLMEPGCRRLVRLLNRAGVPRVRSPLSPHRA